MHYVEIFEGGKMPYKSRGNDRNLRKQTLTKVEFPGFPWWSSG